VEGEALLDFLVELAVQAGIQVRVMPRSAEDFQPAPHSGTCRIRGAPWLLLAAGEPLEDRIEAAARAVRALAPEVLERRYLPPAVRERLDPPGGKAS
jgi:hypothetical protein